jgi:2-phospho-L-lactate guanylyltransferase
VPLPPRIVIPARAPELGKTRLAATLDAGQRVALGLRLFDHVLDLAIAAVGPEAVHVISRSGALLNRAEARGAHIISETAKGLNPALEQAAAQLGRAGSGPILSLSVDLPLLGADDLAALLAAPGDVVCATDALREGTNALLQRSPGLIPYRYGPGSLAAHRAEAEARGLAFSVIERPGLAHDLDTPADLAGLAPDWLT